MRLSRCPARKTARPLAAEALEARTLLSDVVAPLGNEFLVPSDSSRNEVNRTSDAVACDAAGNFVVVWEEAHDNLDQNVVWLRRFSASGFPLGAPAPVPGAGGGGAPAVAMNSRGDFVVTWTHGRALPPNTIDWDVLARRYAPDGAPLGEVIPLNAITTKPQTDSHLAVDEQGGFVATWTEFHLARARPVRRLRQALRSGWGTPRHRVPSA